MLIYCHHCTKPPCKDACPAEAIFRNEQGVVLINEGPCIGCKECMEACSFGAMQFDEDKEVAVKCDLCIERLENNEQSACTMHLLGNTRELSERIAEAK